MTPQILAKEAMPKRRMFLMGNAKHVPRDEAGKFCNRIIDGLFDGRILDHYEFNIGFAAAVDAISRGTIDFEADPIDIVAQAWSDVNNITTAPDKITSVMRLERDTNGA